MDKKTYTVEEYFQTLERSGIVGLSARYLIKNPSGAFEANPKKFQEDLIKTLSKRDGTLYRYVFFTRIVNYPCYSTFVNKLFWDVYVLLTKEGYDLNLESVCEDMNAVCLASDFKACYRVLSYKKNEKDYQPFVDATDRLCGIIIKCV